MKNAFQIKEIEEVIRKMDLYAIPADLLECDETGRIIISGWWVAVPELGISMHRGMFCNHDETQEAYLPDFPVTVIRNSEEKIKEGEWIWYGQDDFVSMLADCRQGEMEISRIEQLACIICLPAGEPER